MNKYIVKPINKVSYSQPLKLRVPGSKSITNRALLLAALADGKSVIKGTLFSDDSRHFLKCLIDLGFEVEIDENNCVVCVTGMGGEIPKKEASIYVGSAGTAARFLTAMLGLSNGKYHIDASEQMRRRPMAPLLASLVELGAKVSYEGEEGHFPFTVEHTGIVKNEITVDIEHSSQFLSALLMCAPLIEEDIKINIDSTHGMAYIDITTKMMEQFGCEAVRLNGNTYKISSGQKYQAIKYQVEPDVSAACYFYAMVPLLGISVLVENIHLDCMQGDIALLMILQEMGCELTETSEGILLRGIGGGIYSGVDVDMSRCSDQTMTLAAIAPFATTPTIIKNIAHIRFQESNRIQAVINELTRVGIKCEEIENGIKIYPGAVRSAEIETYEDHRMAMAFSLMGLRAEGIIIKDPECCAKTFENYFDVLDHIIKTLTI